jgi:hypothetical protein
VTSGAWRPVARAGVFLAGKNGRFPCDVCSLASRLVYASPHPSRPSRRTLLLVSRDRLGRGRGGQASAVARRHVQVQARVRSADLARRSACRLRRQRSSLRGKSHAVRPLARRHNGGRRARADVHAEKRTAPALVARRQVDRFRVEPRRRRLPGVRAADRWRRGAAGHDAVDRREFARVVGAGRPDRVRVGSVSGIFREAFRRGGQVEQGKARRTRGQQGPGAHRHAAALPSLGFVGRGQAPARVRRAGEGRRGRR